MTGCRSYFPGMEDVSEACDTIREGNPLTRGICGQKTSSLGEKDCDPHALS